MKGKNKRKRANSQPKTQPKTQQKINHPVQENIIIGRYADAIDDIDVSYDFQSVRGIRNKDICSMYNKLLNFTFGSVIVAIVSFLLFIYTSKADNEALEDASLFLVLILLFSIGAMSLFITFTIRYIKDSPLISDELLQVIKKDIDEGFGIYAYKNAGLFVLKNHIIGTQKELDVLSYEEIYNYTKTEKAQIKLFGNNSDCHIFKFKTQVECDDAYALLDARIFMPSIDYEDPKLTTNPRDIKKSRIYMFEPRILKEINCQNLSFWFFKKAIKSLLSICLFLIITKNIWWIAGYLEFRRTVAVLFLIVCFIYGFSATWQALLCYRKLRLLKPEELEIIKENINKPDVFFARDYDIYIFDHYLLHFGKDFVFIDIKTIDHTSHMINHNKKLSTPVLMLYFENRKYQAITSKVSFDGEPEKIVTIPTTLIRNKISEVKRNL